MSKREFRFIILCFCFYFLLTTNFKCMNAHGAKLTKQEVTKIKGCMEKAEDFGHIVNHDNLSNEPSKRYTWGLAHAFSLAFHILGEREYYTIVAYSDYRKALKRPLTQFWRRKYIRHRGLVTITSYHVCKTWIRPDLTRYVGIKWFMKFPPGRDP